MSAAHTSRQREDTKPRCSFAFLTALTSIAPSADFLDLVFLSSPRPAPCEQEQDEEQLAYPCRCGCACEGSGFVRPPHAASVEDGTEPHPPGRDPAAPRGGPPQCGNWPLRVEAPPRARRARAVTRAANRGVERSRHRSSAVTVQARFADCQRRLQDWPERFKSPGSDDTPAARSGVAASEIVHHWSSTEWAPKVLAEDIADAPSLDVEEDGFEPREPHDGRLTQPEGDPASPPSA